jgi:hypothetical protein
MQTRIGEECFQNRPQIMHFIRYALRERMRNLEKPSGDNVESWEQLVLGVRPERFASQSWPRRALKGELATVGVLLQVSQESIGGTRYVRNRRNSQRGLR